MQEKVKFSILMSAYNASKTVDISIKSLLNQTYQNYELLVLDNGSKDDTEKVLNAWALLDDRIKVIHIDDNIGWPHGTSELLKHASGDYMMFLAADDFFSTRFALEIVANEIENNESDIILIGTLAAEIDADTGEVLYKDVEISAENIHVLRLDKTDRLYNVRIAIQNTYYNAMFHFEKISFLKRWGIDFYEPFYSDCGAMTEALCRAESISLIQEPLHVLTLNTSQTRVATGLRLPMIDQWESIRRLLVDEGAYDSVTVRYIADAIMKNLYASMTNICKGYPLRDKEFGRVEANNEERYEIVASVIGSKVFREFESFCSNPAGTESAQLFYNELKALCDEIGILTPKCPSRDEKDIAVQRMQVFLDLACEMRDRNSNSDYMMVIEDCLDQFDAIQEKLEKGELIELVGRLKEFV